ncbi:hypothetical protein XM38_041360 [Halomicronema hongdechloris C2206]|uniref:Uncharacterized protein n=1 Tax=Halomicronema hongdechloris C2206 TaxID=1641165 RepID=A0A1Z3HS86_9CYAN|nr:hypothetical protein [Halomicronema hongdechloris]ASC73174.1 hypothetical protein XM38_041360 [Halomicronema hongdechloris C2206]
MVQYTLAQSPEVILSVSGKDSQKARERAMDQLIELMDAGELPTALSDGFGPHQLIEVKEPHPTPNLKQQEDAVVEAVQALSHLANLKMKLQDSRKVAMEARELVDLLFTDEPMSEEQLGSIKDGFKVLKSFAQQNLRYREARSRAEAARQVLDRALHPNLQDS